MPAASAESENLQYVLKRLGEGWSLAPLQARRLVSIFLLSFDPRLFSIFNRSSSTRVATIQAAGRRGQAVLSQVAVVSAAGRRSVDTGRDAGTRLAAASLTVAAE